LPPPAIGLYLLSGSYGAIAITSLEDVVEKLVETLGEMKKELLLVPGKYYPYRY
jgi:hypothetical protein